MKCPACNGKGYREEQHGLIQIGCRECKTTGEVDAEVVLKDFGYDYDQSPIPDELGAIKVDDPPMIEWGGIGSHSLVAGEPIIPLARLGVAGEKIFEGDPVEIVDGLAMRSEVTIEEQDDNGNTDGVKQPDKVTRSRNPRKPRKPKEPQAKKTTRSKVS